MQICQTTNLKKHAWVFIVVFAACGGPVPIMRAADAGFPDLQTVQTAFVKLARSLRPGVVAVTGYHDEIDERQHIVSVPFNHGSGFILGADGLIATNFHVVADVDTIEVTLHDGRHYEASLFGSDYRSDLAVLKINAKGLHAPPTADLAGVEPGQWVITLGNPLGFAGQDGNAALSVGVVSAKGKTLTGRFGVEHDERYYGNMIQTTLSFPPGQSGGAVFNLKGEVIGIAAATFAADQETDGTSFAIPMSRRVRMVLDRLRRGEIIHYGDLGAASKTIGEAEARNLGLGTSGGAMLTGFTGDRSNNPAVRAGLRERDIITRLAGERVHDAETLAQLSRALPIQRSHQVVYYRDGMRHETRVKLAEAAPSDPGPSKTPTRRVLMRTLTWHGTQLMEPTPSDAGSVHQPGGVVGLRVTSVLPNSPFAPQGLRNDMVIVRYNGRTVRTLEDFLDIDNHAGDRLRLDLRDGGTLTLHLAAR